LLLQLAKMSGEECRASSARPAKVRRAEIVRGIREREREDSPDYSLLARARQPPVQVRFFMHSI